MKDRRVLDKHIFILSGLNIKHKNILRSLTDRRMPDTLKFIIER